MSGPSGAHSINTALFNRVPNPEIEQHRPPTKQHTLGRLAAELEPPQPAPQGGICRNIRMEMKLEKRRLCGLWGLLLFHSVDCLSQSKLNTKQKANVQGKRDSAFLLPAWMFPAGPACEAKILTLGACPTRPWPPSADAGGDEGTFLHN